MYLLYLLYKDAAYYVVTRYVMANRLEMEKFGWERLYN